MRTGPSQGLNTSSEMQEVLEALRERYLQKDPSGPDLLKDEIDEDDEEIGSEEEYEDEEEDSEIEDENMMYGSEFDEDDEEEEEALLNVADARGKGAAVSFCVNKDLKRDLSVLFHSIYN